MHFSYFVGLRIESDRVLIREIEFLMRARRFESNARGGFLMRACPRV